jgi:hypothetical protein
MCIQHHEKRPLGKPRRTWEDSIKMDLRERGCEGLDWMQVILNRVHPRAFLNAVMALFP